MRSNTQPINWGRRFRTGLLSCMIIGGLFAGANETKAQDQREILKQEMNTGLPDRPGTFYLTSGRLYKAGEIKLGEARLYPVWGVSYDANIPENRKSWAIAMAHAHQIFRNVLCWAEYPMSGWFATPVKESACGCDPNIENDPDLPFPMKYYEIDDRDGCYQIEGDNSAYKELSRLYPTRFLDGTHDQFIAGPNFETSAIAKAYYDIGAFRFMEVGKGYKIYEFLNEAKDPLAAVKLISAAYNRGWWSEVLNNILVNKRAQAIASEDILEFFGSESVAQDHAAQISQYVLVMTDQAYKLPAELTDINPDTRQPYNYFKGYYNEDLAWSDIDDYLNKIQPLYSGVDFTVLKTKAKAVFDTKQGGNPISFRYDFGDVLDEIMLHLPVDDPTKGIIANYGSQFPADGEVPECSLPTLLDPIDQVGKLAIGDIYPNPTDDKAVMSIHLVDRASVKYQIADYQGRVVDVKEAQIMDKGDNSLEISTAGLNPGLYLVRVWADKANICRKMMVRR